jgi:hypothetical protein
VPPDPSFRPPTPDHGRVLRGLFALALALILVALAVAVIVAVAAEVQSR